MEQNFSPSVTILSSIFNYTSKNYKFVVERSHVDLISGIEEGVFAWLTVNKLSGYLDVTDVYKTVGVLDMGQGSTQITFVPTVGTIIPPGFNYTFKYKNNVYNLYSTSFAGYGYTQALYAVNASVVALSGSAKSVLNPCFLKDFSQLFSPNDAKITVSGTGDWRVCNEFTTKFLNVNASCKYSKCSFNGAFQPPLRGNFWATSNFRDVTKFLGLKKDTQISNIVTEGEKFCSILWSAALKDHSDVDIADLAGYCFGSSYISRLLQFGYGIQPQTSIRIDKNVGELPATWALGLMMHELQKNHA